MYRHGVVWCLLLSLLSGCAAQWQKTRNADDGAPRYTLTFQRSNTAPASGVRYIQPDNLEAGDILFSADSGISSRTLRIVGNTSVSHALLYLGDGKIAEAAACTLCLCRTV